MGGGALAQVESESIWSWFREAAEYAEDAAVSAVEGNILAQTQAENKWDEVWDAIGDVAIVAVEGGILAQTQAENFWDDVGDWFEGAADTIASGVTGATIALGTKKFWEGLGNGIVDAGEAGLE